LLRNQQIKDPDDTGVLFARDNSGKAMISPQAIHSLVELNRIKKQEEISELIVVLQTSSIEELPSRLAAIDAKDPVGLARRISSQSL
jgi:hypothetical protein